MPLEKAWAKVNKKYLNIEGLAQNNSILTLTGFKGRWDALDDELFTTISKGIKKRRIFIWN